jgi:hypothetical protein
MNQQTQDRIQQQNFPQQAKEILTLHGPNKQMMQAFMQNIKEKKNTLKVVKLKFDPPVAEKLVYLDQLEKSLMEIVNLEVLTLSGMTFFNHKIVINILENKKCLKKLDISNCIFDYMQSVWLTIILRYNNQVYDLKQSNYLKELNMMNCQFLSPKTRSGHTGIKLYCLMNILETNYTLIKYEAVFDSNSNYYYYITKELNYNKDFKKIVDRINSKQYYSIHFPFPLPYHKEFFRKLFLFLDTSNYTNLLKQEERLKNTEKKHIQKLMQLQYQLQSDQSQIQADDMNVQNLIEKGRKSFSKQNKKKQKQKEKEILSGSNLSRMYQMRHNLVIMRNPQLDMYTIPSDKMISQIPSAEKLLSQELKNQRKKLHQEVLKLFSDNDTNRINTNLSKLVSLKAPKSIIKRFITDMFSLSDENIIEKIYQYYEEMKKVNEKEQYISSEILYHKTIQEKHDKLQADFDKLDDDLQKIMDSESILFDPDYEDYNYLNLSDISRILAKYDQQSLKQAFLFFCNKTKDYQKKNIYMFHPSYQYLHNDLKMKLNIMKMYDEENKIHTCIKINNLTPWFTSLIVSYLQIYHRIDLSDQYTVKEYKPVYLNDDDLVYEEENSKNLYKIDLRIQRSTVANDNLLTFVVFIILENLQRTNSNLYRKVLSKFSYYTCIKLPDDEPLEKLYEVKVKELYSSVLDLEIPKMSFFSLYIKYHNYKPFIWLNYLYYLKKNYLAKYNALPFFYKEFQADCGDTRDFYILHAEKMHYLYGENRKRPRQQQDQQQQQIEGSLKIGRIQKQKPQKNSQQTISSRSGQSTKSQREKMQLRSGRKLDKDQNRLIDRIQNERIQTLSIFKK